MKKYVIACLVIFVCCVNSLYAQVYTSIAPDCIYRFLLKSEKTGNTQKYYCVIRSKLFAVGCQEIIRHKHDFRMYISNSKGDIKPINQFKNSDYVSTYYCEDVSMYNFTWIWVEVENFIHKIHSMHLTAVEDRKAIFEIYDRVVTLKNGKVIDVENRKGEMIFYKSLF